MKMDQSDYDVSVLDCAGVCWCRKLREMVITRTPGAPQCWGVLQSAAGGRGRSGLWYLRQHRRCVMLEYQGCVRLT